MTTTTKRTITLTGRRPVTIEEAAWPVVASANDDSYTGQASGWRQAIDGDEVDRYYVRVRQNEDGRALVYAVLDAADAAWRQPAHGEGWRGGELLAPGADLAAAITRVCTGVFPARIIRAAIAALPAEEL